MSEQRILQGKFILDNQTDVHGAPIILLGLVAKYGDVTGKGLTPREARELARQLLNAAAASEVSITE